MFYIYDIHFNMEYINIFIYWEASTLWPTWRSNSVILFWIMTVIDNVSDCNMNLLCFFLRDVNILLTTSDFAVSCAAVFSTAGRSTVEDHNRSVNTMSLVNMADVRSPMKLPVTLKDLGLNAVEILDSEVANHQHLHPDDLHARSVDNNTPRWWIVMTIEEYNSIKPTEAAGESTNKVIPALLGSQRMLNFDKLILAPSPQLAFTTMYMHSTEMHVATKFQQSGS